MIHATRIAVTGGTTAGSYGTAVNMTFESYARQCIALLVVAADATYTAAEGSTGMMRLNCRDLGVVNSILEVGPYEISGPATNSGGYPNVIETIPIDWALGGKEVLSVDIAPSGTKTAGALYEIAALWSDEQGQPQDWKNRFPDIVPIKGGDMVQATQLTTTRTALTAITIPSWAREIVGYKASITKDGAITAGEEGIGYFDLEMTIKGTAPQQLPTCLATGATLGTPVDAQNVQRVPWVPIHIPLSGKSETLTPFINLRTAVTTANRVQFSVAWR